MIENSMPTGGSGEWEMMVTARSGDRPRASSGHTDVETRVFAATEDILGEVGFSELRVTEICMRAGVGRGTFYFYFSSKTAVVGAMVARALDRILASVFACLRASARGPQERALEFGIRAGWREWGHHQHVLRAASQVWSEVPEISRIWMDAVVRLTDLIAGEIDRERAAGLAIPGPDSRRLASLLLWSAERAACVAALGVDPELPSEEQIFDSVLFIWRHAIYGEAAEGSARRTSLRC